MGERTEYTSLKGATSWFDRDEAEKWEARDPLPAGEIGTCLFRTKGRAWILCQWRSGEGPWTAGRRRLPCWQVELNKAQEWFHEHGIDEPATLRDDLEFSRNRVPGTPPRGYRAASQFERTRTEASSPPPDAMKPRWTYADLDGTYTPFDPESDEHFHYVGNWDRQFKPNYRADLLRVGSRWIIAFLRGDGTVPFVRPDERGRESAFYEIEIERVVSWFNSKGKPLPGVAANDLEQWNRIGLSARGTPEGDAYARFLGARTGGKLVPFPRDGTGPPLILTEGAPEEATPPDSKPESPSDPRPESRRQGFGKIGRSLLRRIAGRRKPKSSTNEPIPVADATRPASAEIVPAVPTNGEAMAIDSPRSDDQSEIPQRKVESLGEASKGFENTISELISDTIPTSSEPLAVEASQEPEYANQDLVTLDQAAAMVHKAKRTLERYKTRGELPDPVIEGGGGRTTSNGRHFAPG